MQKMQIVHLPEEAKAEIGELANELREAITKYAESKNFDLHPAVPYLAIDILRNAVMADLIKHLEKDKNNMALPAFQMGVA